MPQVIALAIAGAGLFASYKWISREVRRVLAQMEAEDELQRAPAKTVTPKDLGTLEWDPETGVYRPIRHD